MIKALAPALPGPGARGLVAALPHRDLRASIPRTRAQVHLAPVPRARRRRRLVGRRRLGDRRRVARPRAASSSADRGRGDALSALLQAPRVPPGLRGRRAIPRRRGVGARAAHGDHRARARQHRRRRRPLLGAYGVLGRPGRAAAPLPDDRARQDRACSRPRRWASPIPPGAMSPRRVDGRRRLRPARASARPEARSAPIAVNGFVLRPAAAREGLRCSASASTSAAPSPTWSAVDDAGRVDARQGPPPRPPIRRIGVMDGLGPLARRASADLRRRCWPHTERDRARHHRRHQRAARAQGRRRSAC